MANESIPQQSSVPKTQTTTLGVSEQNVIPRRPGVKVDDFSDYLQPTTEETTFMCEPSNENVRSLGNEVQVSISKPVTLISRFKTEACNAFKALVLPRNFRDTSSIGSGNTVNTIVLKFPYFILAVSMVEIFVYGFDIFVENPTLENVFIYNSSRRYEVWRFVTAMLVHFAYSHIGENVIMQLILGSLIETVHGWICVSIIYLSGVVASTLAGTLLFQFKESCVGGASGGVYALIGTHFIIILLNWGQIGLPWLRLVCLLVHLGIANGAYIYFEDIFGKMMHEGHLAGFVAGILTGIITLKDFGNCQYSVYLKKFSFVLIFFLVLTCVIYHFKMENIVTSLCY